MSGYTLGDPCSCCTLVVTETMEKYSIKSKWWAGIFIVEHLWSKMIPHLFTILQSLLFLSHLIISISESVKKIIFPRAVGTNWQHQQFVNNFLQGWG